ncbi:MAG: hypothetical protein MSH08_02820 [Ezakiella sp.]|nr:hypothetical protein [Ezakiella sp.]MDD7472404.1 hypothetical protein [Bacillota bacterium]MDY3923138.1 hypothetical protein [Ezakiella sp.]
MIYREFLKIENRKGNMGFGRLFKTSLKFSWNNVGMLIIIFAFLSGIYPAFFAQVPIEITDDPTILPALESSIAKLPRGAIIQVLTTTLFSVVLFIEFLKKANNIKGNPSDVPIAILKMLLIGFMAGLILIPLVLIIFGLFKNSGIGEFLMVVVFVVTALIISNTQMAISEYPKRKIGEALEIGINTVFKNRRHLLNIVFAWLFVGAIDTILSLFINGIMLKEIEFFGADSVNILKLGIKGRIAIYIYSVIEAAVSYLYATLIASSFLIYVDEILPWEDYSLTSQDEFKEDDFDFQGFLNENYLDRQNDEEKSDEDAKNNFFDEYEDNKYHEKEE